jgi:hypothetical protein
LVVAGVRRCWGVVVSTRIPAISKRCRCLAAAILGKRNGLTMLDCDSSFCFLPRRIFFDLGSDRNGCSCRFSLGGDEQGLDCFFAISSRVLVVKVVGKAVIFLSTRSFM